MKLQRGMMSDQIEIEGIQNGNKGIYRRVEFSCANKKCKKFFSLGTNNWYFVIVCSKCTTKMRVSVRPE
jgi:hypothetical protein